MFEFFKKIIDYCNKHNIPYMLSGSIAMGVYVVPRATRDIDFVINLKTSDIDELVEYFSGDYYCSKTAIEDAISHQSLFNVIDHASGFKADFVILKNTAYRLKEFERKKKVDFYGMEVFVVTPEDLLISKLIWIQDWQAAVQMADIRNLTAIPYLQHEYIHYWVSHLKLNTFDLFNV